MPADVTYHVNRHARLKAQRTNFDSLYQEIAEYTEPHSSVFTRTPAPGERQTHMLYDSTPGHAKELLTATIHDAVMSSAMIWFKMKLRNKQLNDIQSVREWVEEVESRMYLAIQQSPFHRAIQQFLRDYITGTACLYVDERRKGPYAGESTFAGLTFRTYHMRWVTVDEDENGEVDTVYVEHSLSARQCVQRFGAEACGKEITDALEKEPDKQFTVLHCVGPREDYDRKKKNAKNFPVYSLWIRIPRRELLLESGYYEMPYMVARWAKTSGEMYGRGPMCTALPDIATLNMAKQLILKAGEVAIAPPVEVPDDGVIGDVDISAFKVNTVDQSSVGQGNPVIRPIVLAQHFDVSQLILGDLRTSIQNICYWDELKLPSGRDMTATEVEERTLRTLRILAPTLSSLEPELLSKMLDRVFQIMLRAGEFPDPPRELQGQNLDLEYEGPLSRSQRQAKLVAFQRWMSLWAPLAEVDPPRYQMAMDNLDVDEAARDLGLDAGLISKWLKDPKVRDQERQQRAQEQAKQKNLAATEQIAGSIGKAAPGLDAITNAVSTGHEMRNGQSQMAGAA